MKRFSPCKFLFALSLCLTAYSQPQIGGGTCTTSVFNGTYYYVMSGSVVSGSTLYPYAEMGKLVVDGQGNASGRSQASVGGLLTSYTLAGKYSVQANCSGTLTLTANSQPSAPATFQVLNGGEGAVIAYSMQSAVVTGQAYRSDGAGQCGNSSLSGGYGYLLTGVVYAPGGYYYSQAGSVVSDGNGNLSVVSTVNVNGTTANASATAAYSLASDCSGTARVTGQSGTANYAIAVVENGQGILFLETDANTTVGGAAQPQFTAPQGSIVNSAGFQSEALSPGSLFSIFGSGLSQQSVSASVTPLPTNLASTQVIVNGEAAPLSFVGPNQINAQMPLDVPTNQSVSLSIANAGRSSNTVMVTLHQAAPGIFTYGQNRAVVQNPDYSVNSDAQPAHPGQTLVAYLTGGGAVRAAGTLTTGVPAPSGLSPATSQYSVTVGHAQAAVTYLGLTPGFIGLYQANFVLPSLPAGDYPLVVSVGGVSSNAPIISVAQYGVAGSNSPERRRSWRWTPHNFGCRPRRPTIQGLRVRLSSPRGSLNSEGCLGRQS